GGSMPKSLAFQRFVASPQNVPMDPECTAPCLPWVGVQQIAVLEFARSLPDPCSSKTLARARPSAVRKDILEHCSAPPIRFQRCMQHVQPARALCLQPVPGLPRRVASLGFPESLSEFACSG